MIGAALGSALAGWLGAAVLLRRRGDPARGPYPSPDAAQAELRALAASHPQRCRIEEIGRSAEDRPLLALRLRAEGAPPSATRPCVLVTAQIHAVEFVGALVARALATRLAAADARDADAIALLSAADVWCMPLVNPDGAARVWRARGVTGLRGARMTSRGVDPNRNFPVDENAGGAECARAPAAGRSPRGRRRAGWNAASDRPGSAYYCGPHPLSEPECAALARLAQRLRPCAAVHFHSIGAVVYLPADGAGAALASPAFDVFRGPFQQRQPHARYTPVPLRPARTRGQLDPFLWGTLGIPSVTIEVSRPDARVLLPWYAPRLFWWANPPDPACWVENDVPATLFALRELVARVGPQASPDTTERRSATSDVAS